jgi:hypothetical protein
MRIWFVMCQQRLFSIVYSSIMGYHPKMATMLSSNPRSRPMWKLLCICCHMGYHKQILHLRWQFSELLRFSSSDRELRKERGMVGKQRLCWWMAFWSDELHAKQWHAHMRWQQQLQQWLPKVPGKIILLLHPKYWKMPLL